MTELEIRDGDYVLDTAGALRRACGAEALLQRVLFRLTARRGTFPFWEGLEAGCGSWGESLRRAGSPRPGNMWPRRWRRSR